MRTVPSGPAYGAGVTQSAVVRIRRADEAEGERLREIAIAATAYWGYDLDWVRRWASDGDFSPRGLRSKEVYVAEVNRRVVAWAALLSTGDVLLLDDLWMEPECMGKGIGSLLFQHVAERARALGAARLEWEAEPNSVGFYEKVGGRYLRESERTSWGRVIPVMALDLE